MVRSTVGTTSRGISVTCTCGWTGLIRDIDEWEVQEEYDRLVRRCPECNSPRPDWGTFQPLESLQYIASGPLKRTLEQTLE